MCFLSHSTNERKRTSRSISDIESNIREVLPEPPESDTCSEWIMFFYQKSIDHNNWHQTLSETPAKNHDKISKKSEYHVSCLMKYEIWPMEKIIHHSSIDSKCKESEWIIHKKNPKYESKYRISILSWWWEEYIFKHIFSISGCNQNIKKIPM